MVQQHSRRSVLGAGSRVKRFLIACIWLSIFAVLGPIGWLQSKPSLGAEFKGTPRARPVGLRPGDTIMLVAPSGPVSALTIQRIRDHLQSLGYQVRAEPDLDRQRGYLAGEDQRRAEELMAAFLDPDVDAIFPVTGGYGTTRILGDLDFEAINKLSKPKVLIGFSDITGIHLAMAAKTNWITFHSPNPDGGWGRDTGLSDYSSRWFWRCIAGSKQTGIAFRYDTPKAADDRHKLHALRKGSGVGQLTGGNLSLIVALMGTPFELQTAGRVVFLEDVHEAPYRVDRYLSQLKLAGKLDHPAAVILGQFTDADPDNAEASLSMDRVFQDYFADVEYPVITNFPAGHTRQNATLPLGAAASVQADGDSTSVSILHDPVSKSH